MGRGGAVAGTLNARDNNGPQCVVYRKCGHPQNSEQPQNWAKTEVSDTLNIFDNSENRTPTIVLENHPADSRITISKDNIVQTLSSRMGTGGGNTPMVMESKEPVLLKSNQDHATIREDGISTSLVASAGEGGGYVPMVTQAVSIGNGQLHDAQSPTIEVSKTLNCMEDPMKIIQKYYNNLVVRRLTPLECSRLQGLPDGWLDIGEWKDENGKLHKDSDAPKYKCAGNGIATPFWYWLMKRISKQLKADGVETPTMASLFDGSGSFPLLWQYINGDGTAIWSSEIESYPIAVSERHLGENGDWQKFEKPKCLKVIDDDPTT